MANSKKPKSPQGFQAKTSYPEVEKLIESEDFEEVNTVFAKAHDELGAIARKKNSFKKPREAKKAMKALELTMELFRELLSIKYQLQAEHEAKNPSDK